MSPYLELVGIQEQESFKIWKHGYPYETVRWHFHPEYEINYITHTSGQFYVGDHTGAFDSGQLVMTGPNLPHNWISDVPANATVPERCIVLQFSEKSILGGLAAFPELGQLSALLTHSRRGVLFSDATTRRAAPLLSRLLDAQGFQRVYQFLGLLEMLSLAEDSSLLASQSFRPDVEGFHSSTINQVLVHLTEHLDEPPSEAEMARYAGMQPSAFSRFFRRHTGLPFIQHLNRLRINRACELLIASDEPVTGICYACGFNNVSNFNRQFLTQKSMPPSQFRSLYRRNAEFAAVS
ncbi:MAG: AraC family transcriptional regulator [Chitinophagaceae bacterium]|nr:AraC family transcriptional regulator [Rubrivivax sp.]